MPGFLRKARILPLLIGLMGLAMLAPAAMGFAGGEAATGRAFLYPAILIIVLALFTILATSIPVGRRAGAEWLDHPPILLLLVYVFLPMLMAVPLVEAVPGLRFGMAWFEMVSSFTTTGATVFDAPRQIPDAVHLWRGLAGWMGGAFVLSALVVLAGEMSGGGLAPGQDPRGTDPQGRGKGISLRGKLRHARTDEDSADARAPVLRAASAVLPVYALITALAWMGLVIAGNSAFLALMQAMAALSTSGIVPGRGPGPAGFGAELILLLALLPALSRRSLPRAPTEARAVPVFRDPELRLAAALVLAVAGLLLARHWMGAQQVAEGDNLPAAGRALWGGVFTAVSFLTTTGFISQDWIAARAWSGLTSPGLILLGLAMVGGGIATTAGGLKLLRLYALLLQGRRELERMVHPSSVAGGGARLRMLRGPGALAAWLFLMMFMLGTIWLVAALTFMGVPLEQAIVLAVSAITTAGPLAQVAAATPLSWADLSDAARAVLAAGMVLGRLELLLVLSLLLGRERR